MAVAEKNLTISGGLRRTERVLDQELRSNVESGTFYFAEPNLVNLPEVTTEAIKKAVEGLVRNGFLKQLNPSA
jgi:hypothetical protein